MSKAPITLFGIPVVVSLDAPVDKIVLHPHVIAEIENQAIAVQTTVSTRSRGE